MLAWKDKKCAWRQLVNESFPKHSIFKTPKPAATSIEEPTEEEFSAPPSRNITKLANPGGGNTTILATKKNQTVEHVAATNIEESEAGLIERGRWVGHGADAVWCGTDTTPLPTHKQQRAGKTPNRNENNQMSFFKNSRWTSRKSTTMKEATSPANSPCTATTENENEYDSDPEYIEQTDWSAIFAEAETHEQSQKQLQQNRKAQTANGTIIIPAHTMTVTNKSNNNNNKNNNIKTKNNSTNATSPPAATTEQVTSEEFDDSINWEQAVAEIDKRERECKDKQRSTPNCSKACKKYGVEAEKTHTNEAQMSLTNMKQKLEEAIENMPKQNSITVLGDFNESASALSNGTQTPSSIRWIEISNSPTARSWAEQRQQRSLQSATTSMHDTDTDISTYTKYNVSDRPDIEATTSTLNGLVITAVHYSPNIMGHHQPHPSLTSDSTTSTRGETTEEDTMPYIEFTSPIATHQSTWDKSTLL